MNKLLLTFYGDDFTGSADAMEALCLGGARCVLFLEPPTPELLRERFADVRAVGVAGASRAMTPAQMNEALPPVFAALKELGAPLLHYKVCSTFDSSPQVGNIGRAMELGRSVTGSRFIPLLVGAPALRRYTLFGNLFATLNGETYRIDRHPVMSRHPVTPMSEGDLRVHLRAQTKMQIALFDILALDGARAQVDEHFAQTLASKPDAVLFDVLDDARLMEAGRLIWKAAQTEPLFAAGSSGLEYALAAYWRAAGVMDEDARYGSSGAVAQLLVVSGSCSAITQSQIEYARAQGWAALPLNAVKLIAGAEERERMKRATLEHLAAGRSIVLYSALGPNDPAIATMNAASEADAGETYAGRERLAREQGRLLRDLIEAAGLRRVCIAGGDTSSHAVNQLGIYALEYLTPLVPGSPLCRAHSHDARLDGLQIAMKGGQHGGPDYFELVCRGSA